MPSVHDTNKKNGKHVNANMMRERRIERERGGGKRIFELFIISQAVDNQMEALLGKNKLRGKNNKEHCVDDGRRRKLRI